MERLPCLCHFTLKALPSLIPQESNGFAAIALVKTVTAERAIGLVIFLVARALATDVRYWPYSARYTAQFLICNVLQRQQMSFFGGDSIA